MSNKKGVQTILLISFVFLIAGSITLLSIVGFGSKIYPLFTERQDERFIQSFERLVDAVSFVDGLPQDYASTIVIFGVGRDDAVIGYNFNFEPVEQFIEEKPSVLRADYCIGSCICYYTAISTWGKLEKRNYKVYCKDFGENVYFYTSGYYEGHDSWWNKQKRVAMEDKKLPSGIDGYLTHLSHEVQRHIIQKLAIIQTPHENMVPFYVERVRIGDKRFIYIHPYTVNEENARKKAWQDYKNSQ